MIEPAVGSLLAPTMGTSRYGLPGGVCTRFHPILPIYRTPFFLYLTESFWRRCFFLSLKTHVAHMSHAIPRIHHRHFLLSSAPSGLLQHTLRGHSGEITDLAIPPANTELISSSNDGTARVWSLRDGTPVRALPLCDDSLVMIPNEITHQSRITHQSPITHHPSPITTSQHHHITTSPHHHITTSPHHNITTSPHHHITHHHITLITHHPSPIRCVC